MSVWESNLASHIAANLLKMGVPRVVNVTVTELPMWRARIEATVNLGDGKILSQDKTVVLESWPVRCPIRESHGEGAATRILMKLGVP